MIFGDVIPAGVANHLWQSTVFALAAALLAMTLRNNRAQTRYCIWLIASLKFLIPFSVLVAIGSRLKQPIAVPAVVQPALSLAVRQISQPFEAAHVPFSVFNRATPQPINIIPAVILGIWVCGFVAVLLSWSRSWLRVRAAVRGAARMSLRAPIEVLSSPSLLEPGVFGVFRPKLLLPEGITRHLTPAHLEAVLAHELCHVRRRDNLAAAAHMLVEALFWFHPLVWWIGARLVQERERACDEEVLRLGNEPQVYAESILKTCQFYVESPLACVSGVTGSDLKNRIVRIMTEHISVRLNVGKKLLLAGAAIAAITLPLAVGLLHASPKQDRSQAAFEVTSIKPSKPGMQRVRFMVQPGGRFVADGVTLKFLLEEAYSVKESQISGAPPWIDSERYDIEAKAEEAEGAAIDKLPPEQRLSKLKQMIRSLLTDRFKLTLGHETKELPVYALVVAKNGPKFHESAYKPPERLPDSPPAPGGPPQQGILMNGPGKLTMTYVDLGLFADILSRNLRQVVINKTGLTGKYDFTLQWTPEEGQGSLLPRGPNPGGNDGAPPPESNGPSLFTAIQEQLGLKLESQKAPMDILLIEHVEKPSEN